MPSINGTDTLLSQLNQAQLDAAHTHALYNQIWSAHTVTAATALKKVRPRSRKIEEEDEMVALKSKADFTFGCDPEGFVFKGDTPVPASEAGVPGTKEDPFEVEGGWVQVDGMAAEFNTKPAKSFEEFDKNITTVMSELNKLLKPGHSIRYIPSVEFPADVYRAAPEYCKQLGCSPDFDAWSGTVNPPPLLPEESTVRCAGGHLHIGWTENEDVSNIQHVLNCQDLVKQLDWFLGGWSVAKDEDAVRRGLYGKMGAFRVKGYGVEYRVLSNFWVTTKELRLHVWNRMVRAIDTMSNIYLPDRVPSEFVARLRTSINEAKPDAELASLFQYPLMSINSGLNRW